MEEQMAITRTAQNWTTGQTVKVGFMSLVVVQCIPTPGDYRPDTYILSNAEQTKLYKFTPHYGLESLRLDEANDLIAESAQLARRRAEHAIARAMA
jgi:catalase